MPQAKLTEVIAFFEMSTSQFRNEWKELDDDSKAQIREGIGNGSLTY